MEKQPIPTATNFNTSRIDRAKLVLGGGIGSKAFFGAMIELTGHETPRIAIDTSATVSEQRLIDKKAAYTSAFDRLGVASAIWLPDVSTNTKEAQEIIEASNALLVLGGGTRQLHERWTRSGIAQYITSKIVSGELVAGGLSAGAMIWFDKGISDSNSYDVAEGEHWEYSIVDGLGIIPGWATAHYSDIDSFGRLRKTEFEQALHNNSEKWNQAIGIDTAAALVCTQGIVRTIDVSTPTRSGPHEVYLYTRNGSSTEVSLI